MISNSSGVYTLQWATHFTSRFVQNVCIITPYFESAVFGYISQHFVQVNPVSITTNPSEMAAILLHVIICNGVRAS